MSTLAQIVYFLFYSFVSGVSFFCCFKYPKVKANPVGCNCGSKFTLMPPYPKVTKGVVFLWSVLVFAVDAIRNISKVLYSVVSPYAVDVVYALLRPFSVVNRPYESMDEITDTPDSYIKIAVFSYSTTRCSRLDTTPSSCIIFPKQLAVGIIEDLRNFYRRYFHGAILTVV